MPTIIKHLMYFSYMITSISWNETQSKYEAELKRSEVSNDFKTQPVLKKITLKKEHEDIFFQQFRNGLPILLSFDDNNTITSILSVVDVTPNF